MAEDLFNGSPFVGFGCGGYRSFCGPELARIGPFDRVQVIAGQNNCGKSALVDYFVKVVGAIEGSGKIRQDSKLLPEADNKLLSEADKPLGTKGSDENFSPIISFCVKTEIACRMLV